jgi:hypothetical protein
LQTGAPLLQSIVALVAQGFAEVQDAPCVHAVQTPALLHTPVTLPDVQDVPAAWKVWSVQTGAPLVQSVVAVAAHGFAEGQVAPCVHAVHTPPLLHTPGPPATVQGVPAAAVVATVQVGVPLAQLTAALVAHGSVEVQEAPQRRNCQTTRSEPFPWLVQSIV